MDDDDYEVEELQSQSDTQDDLQNAANMLNFNHKKNKDKTAGKMQRMAGKALHLTGKVVEYTGKGIKIIGKGIKKAGEATYNAGKNLWETGKELSSTGLGAIIGVPLCIAAVAVMGLGKALEAIGWSLIQIGKVIEFIGRKIQDAATKIIENANEKIREAGGNAQNRVSDASKSSDSIDEKSHTGGIPSIGAVFSNNKVKFIIALILIIIGAFYIIYVLLDGEVTEENGSYIEGDEKNLPYQISKMVMNNMVIAQDGSGGYTYGFKNETGDIVDIDQSIDAVINNVRKNKSSALSYLGDDDESRKKLLKKMIMAEIATQYPNLSNSVDLGLSNMETSENTSSDLSNTKASEISTNSENNTDSSENTTDNKTKSTNVDEIIKNMTIEEKIYQMIMMQTVVSDGSNYSNTSVGGVIVASKSNYNANLASIGSNYKITPFVATDDEGGGVERAATGYKSAREYGDSENYDELYNAEVKKSNELLSKGINLNLGPVSDVINSGALYNRSFGGDSTKVGKCIETVLKARASVNVNGNSVGSTLKHYPGYPDNETNTDKGIAKDDRSIEKINDNISVFKQGINNGANSVMVSNVIYTNLDANNPASLSPKIISELRSSFSGVIMTDDIGSAAGVSNISDRYKKAILAGNDMISIWDSNLNDAYSQLKAAVDSGEITEERINESVTRILNWKLNKGTLNGNNSSSSNSNLSKATVGTGESKVSEKFNSGEKIDGGINVQRKLESGSVINLKYTSTQNFNALMAANNDDIINYYTLQKNASNTSEIEGNFSGSNNAEIIWNFLKSKGLSDISTAAIIGNLMAESGLNTGLEELTARIDKGYGLAQWTFGRRTQLNTYAQTANKPVSDIQVQLQFLWMEIDPNADHTYANLQWGGGGYGWSNQEEIYRQFTSMTNLDDATALFCWSHERPNATYAHLDKRKSYAKQVYDLYAGKTTSASSSNTDESSDSTGKLETSDTKTNTTDDSAKISSFDKFLFIGDSRYEGISDKLKSLGSNITVCSAVGSSPKEWIEVARNGSGTVKGKAQTLPGTATNISVMLGVNNPSETAQMEQLLNSLHSRYSNCKVFVNSVYNVGSAYSGGVTNDSIKKYNDEIRNFCNQNEWAQYVDVTNGLNDDSGMLKSDLSSDGLHITSDSGKDILVNNIKSAISGSTSSDGTTTSIATSSTPGYSIVVANKTNTITNVIESYSYKGTNYTDVGHSSYSDTSKRWSNPSSGPKSSNSTSSYSSTSVAYQEALKNYTLYFNFLWAILVDTENKNLISDWADLVCNNTGENSKITVTVYSDQDVSTTESQNTRTSSMTSNNGGIVISDYYDITDTIITTVTTITSKIAVTSADTWLVKYENNADNYEEYTSKSKEKITEKVDKDSDEDNPIKILSTYDVTLSTLKREKKMVRKMLQSSEKTSFMVDIFDYIINAASGKENSEKTLSELLDVSSFNLATFTSAEASNSTMQQLGEFNGSFLDIAKKCHAYVRENMFTYAGNSVPITENSKQTIDCSAYVSWVLYEYGYKDLGGGQLGCSGGTLVPWGNNNLQTVWSGFTHNVKEISNIQPGDICVFGYESQKGGATTKHTQIFAGYDSDGKAIWYNCGSTKAIQTNEGSEKYNTYQYDGQGFLYVYRVPIK